MVVWFQQVHGLPVRDITDSHPEVIGVSVCIDLCLHNPKLPQTIADQAAATTQDLRVYLGEKPNITLTG